MHELAEQSVAGTDPARLADLAGRVLAESGFEPGFDAEPRLLGELEQALEAVRADLRATGLAGPVRLGFVEIRAVTCGTCSPASAAPSATPAASPP
ncbi:MAG TPA: hypothetical protein DHU96_07275 [Actinobacteria bacterium]|nr:hypothetical protein [Actinomycetota bacterium]